MPTVPPTHLPPAFTRLDPRMQERAIDLLQERYAQALIGHDEFTERMGMVLQATSVQQIDRALVGLGGALAVRPPLLDTTERGRTGRTMAMVAHASALGSWIIGPAVVHALSPKGSYAANQAARAFNTQLVFGLLCMLAVGGALATEWAALAMPVGALLWFVSTVVGAVRAAHGEDSRPLVGRVLPLRMLDEGPRAPRARKALGR